LSHQVVEVEGQLPTADVVHHVAEETPVEPQYP